MARKVSEEDCTLELAFWPPAEILDCSDLQAVGKRITDVFPYQHRKVTAMRQVLMEPNGRTTTGLRWTPTSLRDFFYDALPGFPDVFFTLCGYYKRFAMDRASAWKTPEFERRQTDMAVRWFNDHMALYYDTKPPSTLIVDGDVICGSYYGQYHRKTNVEFFENVRSKWIDAGIGKLLVAEIQRGELHLEIQWKAKRHKISRNEFYPALFLSNSEVPKMGSQVAEWGWYSPTLDTFGPLGAPTTRWGARTNIVSAVSYKAADEALVTYLKKDAFSKELESVRALTKIPVVGSFDEVKQFWKKAAYSSAYGLGSIEGAISAVMDLRRPTAFDLYVEICKATASDKWRARKFKYQMLKKFLQNPARWV